MKVLTVTPAFIDTEKLDIYFHYGDIQLVMNSAVIRDDRPYGIIWVIDNEASRGGYEGYLSDRLAILGMPTVEIDTIMKDINNAISNVDLRYKVYDY